MDVLPRIIRQLKDLFQGMSPWSRALSMVVSVGILCGLVWLVLKHQQSDFRPIAAGRTFGETELADAERTLQSAGLTEYRREDSKLLAPARDLNRYNAALQESDATTSDFGTQILKQYEKLGPFSTDRQRQQLKEASLLQELRRRIKEVPDVEDAHVAIAASERKPGWNQKPRTTANITIKPRHGRDLSSTLVNSLRHVVANMVPDLKPADVTVFDVSRGEVFVGEPADDPTDSLYLQRAREFSRQYEQQIHKALSYIPRINVTVHVDLDTLKSSLVRSETVRQRADDYQVANAPSGDAESASHLAGFRGSNAMPTETIREVSEKQLVAAIPKAVQVCVTIPRDYLRQLAARRMVNGERSQNRTDPVLMEEDELIKAERIIGRLIPAESSADAVSVTFVDPVSDIESAPVGSLAWQHLSLESRQWGLIVTGVVVILSFIIWFSARSPRSASIPASVEAPVVADTVPSIGHPVPIAVSQPMMKDRVAILRDEIRAMAESDPAAAAAVLGHWLSEAPA